MPHLHPGWLQDYYFRAGLVLNYRGVLRRTARGKVEKTLTPKVFKSVFNMICVLNGYDTLNEIGYGTL